MNSEIPKTNKILKCKLEFECPLLWENLTETKDPKIRFCNKCNENVLHITSQTELENCTSKCVMFNVDIEEISPASIQPKVEQPTIIPQILSRRVMGKMVRPPNLR